MTSENPEAEKYSSIISFAVSWWRERLKRHFEQSGFDVTDTQLDMFKSAIANCLIYDVKKGYKGVWLFSDKLCPRLTTAAHHAGIPKTYFPEHVHMRISFTGGQVGVIDGYGAEYKTCFEYR